VLHLLITLEWNSSIRYVSKTEQLWIGLIICKIDCYLLNCTYLHNGQQHKFVIPQLLHSIEPSGWSINSGFGFLHIFVLTLNIKKWDKR
jgi:hypothetical protein